MNKVSDVDTVKVEILPGRIQITPRIPKIRMIAE